MLIQPVIAYNPQQLDTLDIYTPYFMQFIDSTVSPYDTFYTKAGELKNAYGLFQDSLIVDGALKGDKIYITTNANYPIWLSNTYGFNLYRLVFHFGENKEIIYAVAADSSCDIYVPGKDMQIKEQGNPEIVYLSRDSIYMYDVYMETLTVAVMETLGAYWDTLGQIDSCIYADSAVWAGLLDGYNEDYFLDTNLQHIDSSTFADTSEYARDSDKWDGYQFADYLNQAVLTTSNPLFSTYQVELDSNTVAIGENMWTSGKGNQCVYLGISVGGINTVGDDNIGIGNACFYDNTTGQRNVAIGRLAMRENEGGHYNVAIGNEALRYNQTQGYNVAIGNSALNRSTGGTQNVGIGSNALAYLITGDYNVAIGSSAGYNLGKAGAANCFAMGLSALREDSVGSYNVGIGREAGRYLTIGTHNMFIGYRAGGYGAGAGAIDPDGNVCIGSHAGYNITGDFNVMIGYLAGYYETGSRRLHISISNVDSLIYGEFDNHYLYFKDSVYTKSLVVDKAYIGGGEQLVKFIKVGSHCAIILNASADTFWIASDTTGF